MKIPEILTRAKQLIEPTLKSAIEGLNPDIALAVKYHFGLVDEKGKPAKGGSGKAVRPALAILSAEYVGAKSEVAVSGAVAVELIHNFSLLHDDVIDKDQTRRHRATVWSIFGIEEAIIAGDALQALAFQVLLSSQTASKQNTALSAVAELANATALMIAGQRADMESAKASSVQDCIEMESQKTGALLSCSASIGAILAEASQEQITNLRTFGLELGLAFQAVDDLLGIWGDPEVTGKPAGNDIREKKKSLPIVLGIESASQLEPKMQEAFLSTLTKNDLKEDDIQLVIQALEELDVKTKTQELANQHLELAISAIKTGEEKVKGGEKSAFKELENLAHFVTSRDF